MNGIQPISIAQKTIISIGILSKVLIFTVLSSLLSCPIALVKYIISNNVTRALIGKIAYTLSEIGLTISKNVAAICLS